MKSKNLLKVFSIPLLVIGFCMTPTVAQEQICLKVVGEEMFTVFDYSDPAYEDGWICGRNADPDAPPLNNISQRGHVLDVTYYFGYSFQDEVKDPNLPLPYPPGGYAVNCFTDARPPYLEGVMKSTIQIHSKKNKPVDLVHWGHGWDIYGGVEVLYRLMYVNGSILQPGTLPPAKPDPGQTTETVVEFTHRLIETEGRGKLKNQACTIKEPEPVSSPAFLYVQRCEEQDPIGGDPANRPLPCP